MKMNKNISSILRKCKSLSAKLGRPSSYTSLRSKPTREDDEYVSDTENAAVVFVGSSRRRYTLSTKHLSHPVINALIDQAENEKKIWIKCEVVLFDHLLWMLENADPEEVAADDGPQQEELAQLYS